jgi:hypothetical protein
MVDINYTAPPTVADFMQSESFVRFILGPVGSGKTTGCLMDLTRRMMEQTAAPDGLRHTRFVITRQTLKQLKDTVLKEFSTWLAPIARYKVSDNTIYFDFNDIRSEWLLIPLEDPEDQRRLLSMQITGAWINEFAEVDPDIVPAIAGRCGRYPSTAMGGPTWYGIIGDSNFPTEGDDWWKLFEINRPPDWDLFKQPSGLSADAENVPNLPGGRLYYERLAHGHSEAWVKRYVLAEYGPDPSGTAVYRESFKRSFHVQKEVTPVVGHPLIVGLDFGRDPCAVITQLDHKGRLLVLEEVIAEDIGLELQITRNLKPVLTSQRYMGRPVAIVGDPAGKQRSTLYEETSFDVLKRGGFQAFPAPTNDIDARLRAVEAYLLAQRDGGPAIIFDEDRCPKLIQAMGGGYRYERMRSGQLRVRPQKNEYSHVSDALQYAASSAHGGLVGIIAGKLQQARVVNRPRMSAAGWT